MTIEFNKMSEIKQKTESFLKSFLFVFLNLFAHTVKQLLIEFLCRVVAHLFLSLVHRGNFENNCEISSGAYGDSVFRKSYAHYVDSFGFKTEAVVHCAVIPSFKAYDKVYLLIDLDRTHTEQLLLRYLFREAQYSGG